MNETAILINTRDRVTELAMLLLSLDNQIYDNFDVFILDDAGLNPNTNYHFFNCIVNVLKMHNHKVFTRSTGFPHGVSRARQVIVDWAMESDYKFFVRLDDDCWCEPDYLYRLRYLMKDYDIGSGVTIPCQPVFKRNPDYLKGIICRVILDENGNHILNADDCGMPYIREIILPAHHFRSCAMIKRSVHEKIKYYPTRLSMNGFREEQIFSYKAQMEGFKIGVDTFAITYHQMTPSGGEKPTMNMVPFNQNIFEEFTKENKDKLNLIFSKEPIPDPLELKKENNLI
jgi:glycosyltransferase involved in cell wall biosynthesis